MIRTGTEGTARPEAKEVKARSETKASVEEHVETVDSTTAMVRNLQCSLLQSESYPQAPAQDNSVFP